MNIQLGTIGVPIVLTVKDASGAVVDVSGVNLTNSLYLRSPSNALVQKTPTFVTDGSDGQIEYTLIAGDMATLGVWRVQFRYSQSGVDVPSSVLQVAVVQNIFP